MTEQKAAALNYARLGWRVFPLYWIENGACSCGKKCKSPGKHPIPKNGLKSATTDEAQINKWFHTFPKANIGVETGKQSGIWALDVDTHKGGQESLEAMTKAEPLPDSLHSMTGGGGDHFIFRYPVDDSIYVPSRVEVEPGLDVRGDGGYIVAPPSNHLSGSLYEWEDGYSPFSEDVQEIYIELDRPKAINFGLYREIKATNDEGEPLYHSAPAWNIDESELTKIKVALSMLDVDSRDDWLVSGMALHSTEWDHGFELWCEWAIQSDKFDIGDSRRVWRSFSHKNDGSTLGSLYHLANERNPGWSSGETLTFIDDTNQLNDATAEALAELPFFTAGELLDEDIPPIESWWYDNALSPGTVSLIAGPPKVKKSFFAMGMAMAAACGGEFLEQPFTRPLKVMWVQAELQRGYLRDRFAKLAERFSPQQVSLIRENFIMSDRLELILEQENEFLKLARTIHYYKPDIVVIDPLFNFTLCEENDASHVRRLLRKIGAIRTIVPGSSVVVVHHAKKEIDPSSPFDAIRGSGAFRGYYDFGIMLTPTPEGPRKAYFDVRNRAEIEPMLLEVDDGGKWSIVKFNDDRQETGEGTKENHILNGLDRTGEAGIRKDDFIEMVKAVFEFSDGEALAKVKSMHSKKLIKVIGHKRDRKYILPRYWNPNL